MDNIRLWGYEKDSGSDTSRGILEQIEQMKKIDVRVEHNFEWHPKAGQRRRRKDSQVIKGFGRTQGIRY